LTGLVYEIPPKSHGRLARVLRNQHPNEIIPFPAAWGCTIFLAIFRALKGEATDKKTGLGTPTWTKIVESEPLRCCATEPSIPSTPLEVLILYIVASEQPLRFGATKTLIASSQPA
jgi:hypothetical protein